MKNKINLAMALTRAHLRGLAQGKEHIFRCEKTMIIDGEEKLIEIELSLTRNKSKHGRQG